MSDQINLKIYQATQTQTKLLTSSFSQMLDDIQELSQWLVEHLDISKPVDVRIIPSKCTNRTRGEAPFLYTLPDQNRFAVNLYINPTFNANIFQRYRNTDDLKCTGKYRILMKVLCHEFVHVKQYDQDGFYLRCIAGKVIKFWKDEPWVGPKGATYNAYRNLPWEIEAFGRDYALLDGFYNRKDLLKRNRISLLSTPSESGIIST